MKKIILALLLICPAKLWACLDCSGNVVGDIVITGVLTTSGPVVGFFASTTNARLNDLERGGSTNYIHSSSGTLQAGTTFFVSSGTVSGVSMFGGTATLNTGFYAILHVSTVVGNSPLFIYNVQQLRFNDGTLMVSSVPIRIQELSSSTGTLNTRVNFTDNSISTTTDRINQIAIDTGTLILIGGNTNYRNVASLIFASNTLRGTSSGGLLSDSVSIIFSTHIAPDTIQAEDVLRGVANGFLEVAVGVIFSTHIATGTIDGGDIASETIGAGNIGVGAVATSEILNGTIIEEDIGTGAVTSNSILNNTIAADDLANGSVGTAALADGGVQIADVLGSDVVQNRVGVIFSSMTRGLVQNGAGVIFSSMIASNLTVQSSFTVTSASIVINGITYAFPSTAPVAGQVLRTRADNTVFWGGDLDTTGGGGGGGGVDGSTVGIKPFRIVVGTSVNQNVNIISTNHEGLKFAISSVSAANGGGEVVMREGLYTFTESVLLSSSILVLADKGVEIVNTGSLENILKIEGEWRGGKLNPGALSIANTSFIILSSGGIINDVVIEGLTGTGADAIIIRVVGENASVVNSRIQKNTMSPASTGRVLLVQSNVKNFRFDKNTVFSNIIGNIGSAEMFMIEAGTHPLFFTNNLFTENRAALSFFSIRSSSGIFIANNIFAGNSVRNSIFSQPQGGFFHASGIMLINNIFNGSLAPTNASSAHIRFESGGAASGIKNSFIAGNYFNMDSVDTVNDRAIQFSVTGAGVIDNTFIHGNIMVSTGTFISNVGATNTLRRDNVVNGNLFTED